MSHCAVSAFRFLCEWKSGVIALSFAAVSLSLTYYCQCYNAKTTGKDQPGKGHARVTADKSVVINVDSAEKTVKKSAIADPVIKIIIPPSSHHFNSTGEVEEHKKQGNTEFTQGNYDTTIESYTHTTALLKSPESEKRPISIEYLNQAAIHSELEKYDNCVFGCDRTLELVPFGKNTSSGARDHVEIGNAKQAFQDITTVFILDDFKNPTDTMFAQNVFCVKVNLGQKFFSKFKEHKSFIMFSKNDVNDYMKSFCDDLLKYKFSQSSMKSNINTGLELVLKNVKNKNYESIEEACKELNKIDNIFYCRTSALNLLGTIYIYMQCGNYTCITGFDYFTSAIKISEVWNKIYLLEIHNKRAVKKLNIKCCYAQLYIYANQILNKLNKKKLLKRLKEYVVENPYNVECYSLNVQIIYLLFTQKALLERRDDENTYSLLKKVYAIDPDNYHSLVLMEVNNSST